MHRKITVLFIPQTDRNAQLLLLYARSLEADNYRVLFILRTLSATVGTITAPEGLHPEQVLDCDGLEPVGDELGSEFGKMRYLRRNHNCAVGMLKGNEVDLVVTGHDYSGMGLWLCSVASSLGMPTLSCQEGANFFYRQSVPLWLKAKRLLLGLVQRSIYAHYPFPDERNEFFRARYAALWGDYTRRELLRRGKSEHLMQVVGDPRIPPRAESPASRNGDILFLDVPVRALSRGVLSEQHIQATRQQIVAVLRGEIGCKLLYKVHPLTPDDEVTLIETLCDQVENCTVIKSGTAEQLYQSGVVAVITFPSTAIYSALAYGVPVIMLVPPQSGFTAIEWDPCKRYNAGVCITEPAQLSGALARVRDHAWQQEYAQLSRRAAEDVVGPLDGNASHRFALFVNDVVKKELR